MQSTESLSQWWSGVWKLECPLQIKIFTWLAISNKFLRWGDGLKRNRDGPSHCILCKSNAQTMKHLFVKCSFSKQVWQEVAANLKVLVQWANGSLATYQTRKYVNKIIIRLSNKLINIIYDKCNNYMRRDLTFHYYILYIYVCQETMYPYYHQFNYKHIFIYLIK